MPREHDAGHIAQADGRQKIDPIALGTRQHGGLDPHPAQMAAHACSNAGIVLAGQIGAGDKIGKDGFGGHGRLGLVSSCLATMSRQMMPKAAAPAQFGAAAGYAAARRRFGRIVRGMGRAKVICRAGRLNLTPSSTDDPMSLSFDPASLTLPQGHFIGGTYVEGAPALALTRPSDGQPLAAIPVADAGVVDHAVQVAARAQRDSGWGACPPRDHTRALHAWADLIEAHAVELGKLEAVASTRPISQLPQGDVAVTAEQRPRPIRPELGPGGQVIVGDAVVQVPAIAPRYAKAHCPRLEDDDAAPRHRQPPPGAQASEARPDHRHIVTAPDRPPCPARKGGGGVVPV